MRKTLAATIASLALVFGLAPISPASSAEEPPVSDCVGTELFSDPLPEGCLPALQDYAARYYQRTVHAEAKIDRQAARIERLKAKIHRIRSQR